MSVASQSTLSIVALPKHLWWILDVLRVYRLFGGYIGCFAGKHGCFADIQGCFADIQGCFARV